MKFLCDKCKTRYTISDEKVRGKVLKIRCKNCGNVIEVRELGPAGGQPTAAKRATSQGVEKAKRRRSSQVARLKSSPGQRLVPGPGRSAGVKKPDLGRPGAKRPDAGRSGTGARATKRPAAPRVDLRGKRPVPAPQEEPEQKTVIAAMPDELLRDAQKKSKTNRAGAGKARRGPSSDAAPADWYLGDDRGEYGPMTFGELAARVKRGEPGPNAEAWQEGMDDWRPLEDIPELKPYLKKAPPPRPTTQIKPAPASPLQKQPGRDAVSAPAASAVVPKATARSAEMDVPLVKGPAPTPVVPASEPEAAWPGVPDAGLGSGAAVLPGESPPEPAFTPIPTPASSAAIPAHSAAHVSMRAASDLGTILAEQRKKDRRPILIISLAAVLIAGLAVALVIYLMSSGKKPSKKSSETEIAQNDKSMKAPMLEPMAARLAPRAAMAGAMEHDLSELDIDIDITAGMGSKGNGRRRPGPRPKARGARPAPRRVASGSSDPLSFPSMRPMFVGLMGFGAPRPSGGISSGGSARPGDLGSVVKRNYNRLKRCYEKAARINSRLRNPRLRISIKVSASGKVRSVFVSPQKYAADTLGICVRRSIGAWRFPSFGTGYSYAFTARFHGG